MHAAEHHGAHVTGITLSQPQAELARERVREAGLADRVEIRVADYRELADGPYDKVASVGMYEHVGRGELQAYFASVKSLVRPGGLFLNHGIARIAPHVKRRPWASDATFLSRYVFPDGELSLLGTAIEAAERAGLETRDDESLREHYALTLRAWVANLSAHREQAIAIAGSERERIWRLYMTGAALAFEAGEIGVHQTLFAIPGERHGLPLVRKGLLPHASAPSF
jgi:cyclopropane-fatty-acyl-phospholipid synthase